MDTPGMAIVDSFSSSTTLLSNYVECYEGLSRGDTDRFDRKFWELSSLSKCPSSKQMGLLSVFHKGGSGSSLFDVKPLGVDSSSGGFGWSVF